MKNCVITYIFGTNKEKLREPKVIDKDTEYLCITDNPNLQSKNWKIVFDPMKEISSLRDKMAWVKYNPFKYTNSERILIMDGTLEIKSSLLPFFEEIDNYDIGLKLHTYHFNLKEELPHWISRGLPKETILKFYKMAEYDKIDLSKVVEYETCIILYKNNDFCKEFGKRNLSYMKFLGNEKQFVITNQCPLSYMVHKEYKDAKILKLNQFDYFNRYIHNSNVRWEK